jgi:hypothetical protein
MCGRVLRDASDCGHADPTYGGGRAAVAAVGFWVRLDRGPIFAIGRASGWESVYENV